MLALAAIKGDGGKNLVKSLVIIVRSYEDKLSSEDKASLSKYASRQTNAVVKNLGIDVGTYSKVIESLRKGLDPNEDSYEADVFDSNITSLAKSIRENIGEITKEHDISKPELTIIKSFSTWVSRRSNNALNAIKSNVSFLGDTELSRNTVHDVDTDSQSSKIQRINDIVREVSGNPKEVLDVNDRKKLKDENPDLLKEYNRLRREVNDTTKKAIANYVKLSGKKLVKISELVKYLNDSNIKHNIVSGFRGYMDEHGNYYTNEGRQLQSNLTGRVVSMNPSYDPIKDEGYVLLHMPIGTTTNEAQRIYTKDNRSASTNHKFNDVVGPLIDSMPKLRKKWRSVMKSEGVDTKEGVASLLLEILFETSGRVGTTGKLGISTLTKANINITPKSIIFKYKGKGKGEGGDQRHVIKINSVSSRLVHKLLKELVDKSGRGAKVFMFNNKPVTSAYLNKYLSLLGAPAGTSVHKFRHVAGTTMAKEILDSNPFTGSKKSYSDSDVNKWLKKALEDVGAKLGHQTGDKVTSTTALKNYIDPSLIENFLKKLKVRPDASLHKILEDSKHNKG